ncbi:MAG: DUF2958 domain-containing protein [Candidatus Woesearchaeota archaeon]
MTKELEAKLPALYSQENVKDPMVLVHYFNPSGQGDWYVIEYHSFSRLCFGLVSLMEEELGYFYLDELEEVKGPLELGIERDLHWTPKPLSQCYKKE